VSYTTITAIVTALEKTIMAVDPIGDPSGQGKYRKTPTSFDWTKTPETAVDRAFEFSAFDRGRFLYFGQTTEIDYEGTITLKLGCRKIPTSLRASAIRRDTDIAQVSGVLEKSASLPTGVSLIRLLEQKTDDMETKWVSTLSFKIAYRLAVP
jgi:hypothetical protein